MKKTGMIQDVAGVLAEKYGISRVRVHQIVKAVANQGEPSPYQKYRSLEKERKAREWDKIKHLFEAIPKNRSNEAYKKRMAMLEYMVMLGFTQMDIFNAWKESGSSISRTAITSMFTKIDIPYLMKVVQSESEYKKYKSKWNRRLKN